MGALAIVDAVALAPAAGLGLFGVWLGLGRAAVAWPLRWLVPLLGACVAALPAALYLAANGGGGPLGWPGTMAMGAAGAAAFIAVLVLLAMFMRNLRERVAVWSGSRRPGPWGRIGGGAFCIACGLLLVGLPCGIYASLRPEAAGDPAWLRQSLSLAYFRVASEAVRSALAEPSPSLRRPPRR